MKFFQQQGLFMNLVVRPCICWKPQLTCGLWLNWNKISIIFSSQKRLDNDHSSGWISLQSRKIVVLYFLILQFLSLTWPKIRERWKSWIHFKPAKATDQSIVRTLACMYLTLVSKSQVTYEGKILVEFSVQSLLFSRCKEVDQRIFEACWGT